MESVEDLLSQFSLTVWDFGENGVELVDDFLRVMLEEVCENRLKVLDGIGVVEQIENWW